MGQKSGNETIESIMRKLEVDDFASTARLIELVRDLTHGYEKTSVDHLASLISCDVGLATKVIHTAQPIRYNPEGVEVETLSQAVHLIGLTKIRTVAISLLVVEDTRNKLEVKISNEVNTVALCSAMIARAIAVKFKFADPELCFVSGLLQFYGNILTARFYPHDFVDFKRLEAKYGSKEAHEIMFGLSHFKLSKEVLKWQNMPKSIMRVLADPTEKDLKDPSPGLEAQPFIAGSFGKKTASMIGTFNLTHESFEEGIKEVLIDYCKPLSLKFDDFHSILIDIFDEIMNFKYTTEKFGFSELILRRIKILAMDATNVPPVTQIEKLIRANPECSVKDDTPLVDEEPEEISTTHLEDPELENIDVSSLELPENADSDAMGQEYNGEATETSSVFHNTSLEDRQCDLDLVPIDTIEGYEIEPEPEPEPISEEEKLANRKAHSSTGFLYKSSIGDLLANAQKENVDHMDLVMNGLEVTMNIHKASCGMVFLLNPKTEQMEYRGGLGEISAIEENILPFPYAEMNLISHCLEQAQSTLHETPSSLKNSVSFPVWLKEITHIKPFIIIPLYFATYKVGAILLAGGEEAAEKAFEISSTETSKFAQIITNLLLKKDTKQQLAGAI